MDKLSENIKAMHQKMQADIIAGDQKAITHARSRFGELNATRASLGLESLFLPSDSSTSETPGT